MIKKIISGALLFSFMCSAFAQVDENKLSLNLQNVPMRDALRIIAKQTQMRFLYADSLISDIFITCNIKQHSLTQALNKIILPQNLDYKITSRTQVVVFKRKHTPRIDLYGNVIDAQTLEPLPYANIELLGSKRGISTNTEGYFTFLDVPANNAKLRVQYIGYQPQDVVIDSFLHHKKQLYLKLKQKPLANTPLIVESYNNEVIQVQGGLNKLTISPHNFTNLPVLGDRDINKTMQLLPGVTSSNFGASGLNIRGGLPSQNLILLDGMKLYHINHLFGFFSSFNSGVIKDAQIYKSSVPTRFGERISGVVELTAKNGNSEKPQLNLTLSQSISGAVLELPLFGHGSALLSFRRSYSDLILGPLYDRLGRTLFKKKDTGNGTIIDSLAQIETNSDLYFYDLLAKVSFYTTQKNLFSISYYKGLDNLEKKQGFTPNIEWRNTKSKWGNMGNSFKWYREWSPTFTSKILTTYSDYFTNSISKEEQNSIVNYNHVPSQENTHLLLFKNNNNVEDYTTRWDNAWQLTAQHKLEFGFQHTQTFISNTVDQQYFSNEFAPPLQVSHRDNSILNSSYIDHKWHLTDFTTLNLGLRFNYFSPLKKPVYEPRFFFNYTANSTLSLSAGYGKYYQYILQYGDGQQSLDGQINWVTANNKQYKPGESDQFTLGAHYEAYYFTANIEAYYKKLKGVLEANNDWQYEFIDSDIRQVENDVVGVDLIIHKKNGNLTGWISYGLSRSQNYFNAQNETYPSSQDMPHNIKIVANYSWNNFNFSASWRFASGKPYSIPKVEQYQDGLGYYYYYLASPDKKNSKRLPNSHQLDLSINYNFKFPYLNGKLGLSIFDAYNKKNIWYRDFTISEGKLSKVDVNMFGFTPTFFLDLTF